MKRDLNLIPRAEAQSEVNKYILPIVLIVVLYAATAYLAVTIPNQRLQAKEDEYAIIEQKVAELEYVEAEYQALRAQLAEIEAKKETIEQTQHSDKDAINVLDIIETACPQDVTLTDVTISSDGIYVIGTAVSDTLVAEFMVNLRAVELFSSSNISLAEPSGITFEQEQEADSGVTEIIETRTFELALTYSADEILDELTEEGS